MKSIAKEQSNRKSKKILFNCLTLQKGGAERVIATLANELVARGDKVVIMTLTAYADDKYPLDRKVRRVSIDKRCHKESNRISKAITKLSPQRIVGMNKAILKEEPDIILSFLPEPSLRLMLLKKLSKKIKIIPTIISIRNDPEVEYKNKHIWALVKKLYNSADGMVYQTNEAKNFFDGIIKTTNQSVISNPISKEFCIEPKSDKDRSKTIISVGRLEPQKNHELLIRAFASIDDKLGYRLEIYGDGSEKNKLQSLINNLGVDESVKLMGQQDSIQTKMNASRIFVLSSDYEGMPNSLMEAMALGLPCISTDCPCGGPRSIITNNNNGLLVETKDRHGLTLAMTKLINNPNKRKALSKNALSIRKSNSIETITNQWEAVIWNAMKNDSLLAHNDE